MADAYRLKADASFHQPLNTDDEGNAIEVIGRTYNEGDFILASDMTKHAQERAESGELDHLLEAVSTEEAESGQEAREPALIAEHEAERVVFGDAGKTVVPRDQVIELAAAGAEGAKAAQEAAKSEGVDERPAITASEVPSLAAVEQGESELGVVPQDSEPVNEERLEGIEQPPGLPIGDTLRAARGGEQEAKKATRSRPRQKKEESDNADEGDK